MSFRLKFVFLYTTLCWALLATASAQLPKDSAARAIQHLTALYHKDVLQEDLYLDTVARSITLIQSQGIDFSNKELLALLAGYRQVVWARKDNIRLQQSYYSLLSHAATMGGRNGEMLYYAEQLNNLEEKISNTPSINALSSIASYYYGTMAYQKVIGLYEKHKQFIGSIPQRVASRQYEKKVLMKCGDLLSSLLSAAYRIDNDTLGAEIGGIMDRLIQSIRTTYATDAEVLIRLQYSIVMAEHEKYRTAGDVKGIWKCILQLDSLLNDAHTPAYLKSYIGFATTDKKALYFLDTRKNDSAKHYVGLLNAHYGANISVPFNAYMVKKYEARLLYNDGHYKESEDTLAKSLEILETATSGMTTEVDEVMYALTEVEDQQLLLAESARREKQADRNLMLLSFGSFTLLVGSALVLMLVRRRQKTRFLNFKLHLAQNIHDETNPALLYAKMLAKEQRVSQSDEKTGELEKHIDHTMELIRSLSKDLRSDEHLLLADLVQDVREMIGKISKLSDFSYTIQEPKDMKRFLSHYQYTNLNAILQECVTNSIKHADFKRVSVAFSIQASMLKVVYKDDGRGWEPSQEPQGIGLKNMQERMARLNGDMAIENDYPNGFQITLSVKLS